MISNMTRKMILLAASVSIAAALALPALPQSKKAEKKESIVAENGKVTVTIQSVTKNDAGAKKNAGAKSRNVPVNFTWLCGSEGNAKLAELIAELVTRNTDGSTTRVSKKL